MATRISTKAATSKSKLARGYWVHFQFNDDDLMHRSFFCIGVENDLPIEWFIMLKDPDIKQAGIRINNKSSKHWKRRNYVATYNM